MDRISLRFHLDLSCFSAPKRSVAGCGHVATRKGFLLTVDLPPSSGLQVSTHPLIITPGLLSVWAEGCRGASLGCSEVAGAPGVTWPHCHEEPCGFAVFLLLDLCALLPSWEPLSQVPTKPTIPTGPHAAHPLRGYKPPRLSPSHSRTRISTKKTQGLPLMGLWILSHFSLVWP